jgi:tryptophan-rich sensory protein
MDVKLFITNFGGMWDVIIGGIIVSFSFAFILSPKLSYIKKVLYSFVTALLLVFVYTFFKTEENNLLKILISISIILLVILFKLIKLKSKSPSS